jgi:hypothetical protein
MSMLSQKNLAIKKYNGHLNMLRYEVGGQFGTILEHPIISQADVICSFCSRQN